MFCQCEEKKPMKTTIVTTESITSNSSVKEPEDPWEKAVVRTWDDDLVGEDLHKPGAKDDGQKVDLTFLSQFGSSLTEVSKLADFGAKKYSRGGWMHVLDAERRYTAAMLRHYFAEENGEVDDETGLLHATAVAWNALARLKFILERRGGEVQKGSS